MNQLLYYRCSICQKVVKNLNEISLQKVGVWIDGEDCCDVLCDECAQELAGLGRLEFNEFGVGYLV